MKTRHYTLTPLRALALALACSGAAAAAVLGRAEQKPHPVVVEWNNFARSINKENKTLHELQESLKARRPDQPVVALEREALYREAILQHEYQTECLKRMLAAEFGEE